VRVGLYGWGPSEVRGEVAGRTVFCLGQLPHWRQGTSVALQPPLHFMRRFTPLPTCLSLCGGAETRDALLRRGNFSNLLTSF